MVSAAGFHRVEGDVVASEYGGAARVDRATQVGHIATSVHEQLAGGRDRALVGQGRESAAVHFGRPLAVQDQRLILDVAACLQRDVAAFDAATLVDDIGERFAHQALFVEAVTQTLLRGGMIDCQLVQQSSLLVHSERMGGMN